MLHGVNTMRVCMIAGDVDVEIEAIAELPDVSRN